MKKIQIIGMGCSKCNQLYAAAEAAAKELGIKYEMEKIADINRITDMGVMITPALAINDKLKFSAKIPGIEEIKKIISDAE